MLWPVRVAVAICLVFDRPTDLSKVTINKCHEVEDAGEIAHIACALGKVREAVHPRLESRENDPCMLLIEDPANLVLEL